MMRRRWGTITLWIALLMSLGGCGLWTGKGVLPGRSQGMATLTVTGQPLEAVEAAIHEVFVADRFELVREEPRRKLYEREASLMKDLAYGGLLSEGSLERASLEIHDEGEGVHRVECNVIVSTGRSSLDQAEVLRLFAGQYRRLLRRVAARLE